MKKFVAILLCMTMLFSLTVTAGAVSERNGWVYSNIDSSDVLSVDGLVVGGELENAQTLNVPYAILGMPVIRVGKSAFMNNTTARNINLTENIREISDSAMYGMTALENVALPKNLTILGVSAFAYCSSLQSVSFQTVKLSQIKNYTFYGCTQLNNVILSDSITELDDYCFAQCLSMDKIYIPTSVSLISDKAFYGTKNGFTIYGYQNSYAYTYAVENNIPFVDMTEKSLNQLSDLISIAEYMLREENIAPYTTESADILAQMYQNAVAVKNNFFSSPDDIAQMQTQLENAYHSLRLNSMNDLDEAVIQAESTAAVSFRYTGSSVKDLEQAIHQARTVQNTVLPSETQVQNAIQNLNSKINALVDVIKYDINSDGEITLSDVILVQKRLISDYHFNQREIYLADFNSDNKITLSDIVLFQRYLLTR